MKLSVTRHPGIELVDFEDSEAEAEEGQKKMKILQEMPQSYAFLADGSQTEDEETSKEGDESEGIGGAATPLARLEVPSKKRRPGFLRSRKGNPEDDGRIKEE